MRSSFTWIVGLISFAGTAAAAPGTVVSVWTRPAGGAAASEAAMGERGAIDMAKLPARQIRRYDVQYGRELLFRGVPLSAVLEAARPPTSADLALLHFANGMVIPLPFRDRQAMARLDPLVAFGAGGPGEARPGSSFPPLVKNPPPYAEFPRTAFSGNKLVVADRWHPAVDAAAAASFSPWTLADTLVGIELVESTPYYRQFDVGTTREARAGFAQFQRSCQFCHGSHNVGAKFGWDFSEPAPLSAHRQGGKRLYYHVRYRRTDAAERGQMMPALKFITMEDAAVLWQWLEAVGTSALPPYAPSTHTASRR